MKAIKPMELTYSHAMDCARGGCTVARRCDKFTTISWDERRKCTVMNRHIGYGIYWSRKYAPSEEDKSATDWFIVKGKK